MSRKQLQLTDTVRHTPPKPLPTRDEIATRLTNAARRIREGAGADAQVLLCTGELASIVTAVLKGAPMPPLFERLCRASYALRDRSRELKVPGDRTSATTPDLDRIQELMLELMRRIQ